MSCRFCHADRGVLRQQLLPVALDSILMMLIELFLALTADAHRAELHHDERGVRAAHRFRGDDGLLSNRASLLRRLPHLDHREPAARLHRDLHST